MVVQMRPARQSAHLRRPLLAGTPSVNSRSHAPIPTAPVAWPAQIRQMRGLSHGSLDGVQGDHTFFLDRNGLNIVEPAEAAGAAAQSAKVVNLASWSDDDPTGLELHEPE